MRRNIRLKEYDPLLERTFGPSENYLKSTIPGFLELEQFKVRVNSSGFILPHGRQSNETKNSSIILGGSTAECLFMKEEYRIESILAKKNPLGIYLNGAISSSTTLDTFNAVLNKIIPTKPSKIFYLPGAFDARLLSKGFYSPDSIACTTSEPTGEINIENNFFSDRRTLLKYMFNIIQSFGIELFVGTFSHRHNPQDPYKIFVRTANRLENTNCLINSQTRELAVEVNAKLVDLEELMYTEFDLHYDNHHLTPKGSAIVASHLFDAGF
jgi:hypothetical protein